MKRLHRSHAILLPILLGSVTLVATDRGHGPDAAQKDLSKFTVADGLEVSVFAAEPMVQNPTNIDIDHRGRVWVSEGVNYRSSFKPWGTLKENGDRIVILEDTDHDGKADSEKVFYEGKDINAALGICVLGHSVIVSCSPNIILFQDTDGDDKADSKKILFSGIGGVDHDHGAHAFTFGPDGKLYFNIGNDGKRLKTADGRDFVVDKAGNKVSGNRDPYQQGLVFRCDPDGSNLETLAWNFRNNYEVAVDSYGTLWQSDNDDDGNRAVRINYVMEYGNYGYRDEMTGAGWRDERTNLEKEIPLRHWHLNDPGVVPNLLQTGAGSPTGILVYEGSLLPEIFHGQVIHCDAGPNVVRAYPAKASGAGYEASIVNVLKSKDTWFRPSDVCVAPDGSLIVADWNDPGVGGHNMGDNKPGTIRGRLYRVAPPKTTYSVPKVDFASVSGAIEALQSPNLATRHLAWKALKAKGRDAESALVKLYKSDDSRMRARALHLLAKIPGRAKTYIDWGFMDTDPNIRVTALRMARQHDFDLTGYIQLIANDKRAPRSLVREAAIALRHGKVQNKPSLWAGLAKQHDGKDRWYLEALGIGADQDWDACLAAWLDAVGDKWNSQGGRDIIWRSRSAQTADLLVQILTSSEIKEDEKPRYMRAMDFLNGPEKEAALLKLLTLPNS